MFLFCFALRSSVALELYIPMFVIVEFVDHSISCFAIHFIKFIRTSVFQAPRTSIIHQGNKIRKKHQPFNETVKRKPNATASPALQVTMYRTACSARWCSSHIQLNSRRHRHNRRETRRKIRHGPRSGRHEAAISPVHNRKSTIAVDDTCRTQCWHSRSPSQSPSDAGRASLHERGSVRLSSGGRGWESGCWRIGLDRYCDGAQEF